MENFITKQYPPSPLKAAYIYTLLGNHSRKYRGKHIAGKLGKNWKLGEEDDALCYQVKTKQ